MFIRYDESRIIVEMLTFSASLIFISPFALNYQHLGKSNRSNGFLTI